MGGHCLGQWKDNGRISGDFPLRVCHCIQFLNNTGCKYKFYIILKIVVWVANLTGQDKDVSKPEQITNYHGMFTSRKIILFETMCAMALKAKQTRAKIDNCIMLFIYGHLLTVA